MSNVKTKADGFGGFRVPALVCVAMIVVLTTSIAPALDADSASEPASESESASPRPTMRAVFDEMKELIPLSLDATRWTDPASHKRILASFERLEVATAALENHGRSHEAGFAEIAFNLGHDLADARERYREGAFEESRFFLTGSLQSCVSCHVRLPSNRAFPLADQLMDRVEIEALSPREKAWLLVIVRRFDAALETWEGLIQTTSTPAAQLDAGGVLVDYLNVAIRVRGAVERASKTLARFEKRDDLPFYLRRRVREWRSALGALDAKRFSESSVPSISLGTALAQESGTIVAGPYGREGLIQDLAAASQLVRWLEQDQQRMALMTRNRTADERRDAALAYYWLGVVEARSLDGFWVNLSERHLEAAIRADPKGPIAEKSYALLEETQILGYGGSSGVHLPIDVLNLLEELRGLMDSDG